MEQNKQGERRLLLTDGWAGLEMVERIHIPILRSIKKENDRLIETLQFLDDAFAFGAIERYMWIESIIRFFTDGDFISELMEKIPPEHTDRISRPQIKKVAKYLSYWRNSGLLYEEDTIENAVGFLHVRLFDNMNSISSFS